MGVRLHYAKRYDVQYSESAFGNYLRKNQPEERLYLIIER